MKLHLPSRLYRAVVACLATAAFSSSAFADVPPSYPSVHITSSSQLSKYTSSYHIAFIIGADITDSEYRMTGWEQYWGDQELQTHVLTFTGLASSNSGGALTAGVLTAEFFEEFLFIDNNSSDSGGAIYVISSDSSATMSGNGRVAFIANSSTTFGGAIYADCTLNLTDNDCVEYSGNSAEYGGAIYVRSDSSATMSGNGNVTFSGNSAREGSAIYVDSDSSVTISDNGSVTFIDNSSTYGGAGAIHLVNGSSISLTNNTSVTFNGNSAEDYGAICSFYSSVTMSDNGNVTFSGNSARVGGAIYAFSSSVTMSGNGRVAFIDNSSTYGGAGAIHLVYGSSISLTNNTSVTFNGNSAEVYGAIYVSDSSVTMTGNESAEFRGNYCFYPKRLRSVYMESGSLNLAAGQNQGITFYDTLYAGANTVVNFNGDYLDKDGAQQHAVGDIVFSGKHAKEDLVAFLPYYSPQELLDSQTTEVYSTTNLYGGRLRIEDEAVYKGNGIDVAAGSGATLQLVDGTLDQAGYSVTLNTGTTLDLQSVNRITASCLDMRDGSTLSVSLGSINAESTLLTLSGDMTLGGDLNIVVNYDETAAAAAPLRILDTTFEDAPIDWSEQNISVSGVEFDKLQWRDGILYLNLTGGEVPQLDVVDWQGGDMRWNTTSANWISEGVPSCYVSGDKVRFGDTGSGEIILQGELTPRRVMVDNSLNHDYTFTGEGRLSGYMLLTKAGDGKLTISTSNDYTRGTILEDGTLVAGRASAFGSGAITVFGGVLDLGGFSIANVLSVAQGKELVIRNGTLNCDFSAKDSSIDAENVRFAAPHSLKVTDGGKISFKNAHSSSRGGAIYAESTESGSVTMTGNEYIIFSGNSAGSGGAIMAFSGSVTMTGNEHVIFSGNSAAGSGGAIQTVTLNLTGNECVIFSGNSAGSGGAIAAVDTLNLTNNKNVGFIGNSASSRYVNFGGAIYNRSALNLTGNDRVEFRGNYEQTDSGNTPTYRLRSVYATGYTLNLAAGEGQDIVFYDTLYAKAESGEMMVSFNADYCDGNDVMQKAKGDIVFSGAHAEEDLRKLKPNYTQQELVDSLTTEVYATTNLYGGRLRIEDGAIYKGNGINVAAGSGATLRLVNGALDQAGYEVTLNSDTTLDLQGVNNITAAALDMQDGSTLSFNVGEENLLAPVLTLSGSLNQGGNLTIMLSGDTLVLDKEYALLQMSDSLTPSTWDWSKISVSGLWVDKNALNWSDGTLYLTLPLPELETATWSGAQSHEWNFTEKNWIQGNYEYRYKDGVDVVFGDEGCGEVGLSDELAPLSVLVENSEGHDYTFAGEGSMTGVMELIKEGDGTLTISTANEYTGGVVINGGVVVVDNATALGSGDVALNGAELNIAKDATISGLISAANENTLVVEDGHVLTLGYSIENSGTIIMQGAFDISALSCEVAGTDYMGGAVEGNGFARTLRGVQVVDNGAAGYAEMSGATFFYNDEEWADGDNGYAVKATMDYSKFYVNSGTDSAAKAYTSHTPASIQMQDGTGLDLDLAGADIPSIELAPNAFTATLNVKQTSTIEFLSGGDASSILSINGTLGKSLTLVDASSFIGTISLTDTALQVGGDLTIAGSWTTNGTSSISVSQDSTLTLMQAITNQGSSLALSGTFDVSALSTIEREHTYTGGATEGNGFFTENLGIQVVNNTQGGTSDLIGGTFLYNGEEWAAGDEGYVVKAMVNDSVFYVNSGTDSAAWAYAEHTPASIQMQDGTGLDLDLAGADIPSIELAANAGAAALNIKQATTVDSISGGDAETTLSIGGTTGEALTIMDASGYQGTFVINSGTLAAGGEGALGVCDIQMNGGRLDLGGNIIHNAVNATGEVTIGNGYLCSDLTLDGADLKIDKDLSLPYEPGASPLWQIRVTGETESSIAVAKGAVLSMCMPIYNEAYVSLSGKIDIGDMNGTYVGTSYKGGEIEGNGYKTMAYTAKVIDNAMGAAFDWKKADIYYGDILATKDKSGSVSFEYPYFNEFYIFSGTEKVSTARSRMTEETPLDYIHLAAGTTLRVDEDFDLETLNAEDETTLYVEEGKTLSGTSYIANSALAGAGRYVLGEKMTLGSLSLSDDWTGVVSLSGEAEDIDLDAFWREGSWVELNGMKTPVTKTSQSISADIILTDMEDGTAAYCTALTERTIARSQIYTGAIKGDGTFVVDVGKNNYMYCEFSGDISAWTGEFRYVGKPEMHLTIAGDAKVVNAAITGSEKLDLEVESNAEFNGAVNVNILSLANSSSEFNGAINVNKLTLNNSSATFNGELQVETGISTSGTSTLTIGEGKTYTMDTAIANSGDLTLHGTFDASGLPRSFMGGEYMGAETEGNGYYAARYGILVVKNASQAKLDWDDAEVIYKDIDFEKRADGVLAYSTIDDTMFYIGSGTERVSSAQDFAAAAGFDMKGICMFYDTALVVDRDVSTEIIQPYYNNCNFTLNIENGATLQSEGTERLHYSVTGSGTYRLVEGSTTLDTTLDLDWCGTVVITSAVVDNFDLNQYGYEGSAVRLDSVSGSLVVPDSWDAYVFSPALDLAGSGFEITLCGGEDVYEFAGGVRGAGNLTYNPGKFAHNETYIFSGDVSEWTGAFESVKDKKESWLVFRGDATEMGAAIRQTAGTINVEVGDGSNEHTTAFKNEVEASTFTVYEKATAVIESEATITESLSLQGSLEVHGGSLNLAEDAVVEVGEAYTIAGSEGSAPSISGDIRMNESGLYGTSDKAARIDHSVIKLEEGASVVFDNVILGASSQLKDDPATVVVNNMVIEGILGENVQEGEPMTIKSGSVLHLTGNPGQTVVIEEDSFACTFDITNVQDVQLSGNCLTIDLSSMYPKFKDMGESFDWLGIALGSGDHAPTIDENLEVVVQTLPNQRARGYVGWGGTFVTVPDHGENVGPVIYFHMYEVPEPTTSTLSLLALAALAARRRRK